MIKLFEFHFSRPNRIWAAPAIVTTWFSVEQFWAGGKSSTRGTERTETNIWTNTLCLKAVSDLSMVCLNHTHSNGSLSAFWDKMSFFLIHIFWSEFIPWQVLSPSSVKTCRKQSWFLVPGSANVKHLSTISTATRMSCLKLYCWLDYIPTLFR